MNNYNSLTQSKERLHEISLDDVSGIDTMMNNINKSSNLLIRSVAVVPSNQQLTPQFVDTMPGVVITPIYQSHIPGDDNTIVENKVKEKVDNLDDKTKNKAILVLSVLLIVFIAIAIFK